MTVFLLAIASIDEMGDFSRGELLDLFLSPGQVYGTPERAMAAAEAEWQEIMDPGFDESDTDDDGEPLVWEGEEPLVFVLEGEAPYRQWTARPEGDDGQVFVVVEREVL